MKKFIAGFVLIWIFSQGTAQRMDSVGYYVLQSSVGYTSFALGDVRDFYDEVLDVYDEMGLHVPTQKDYAGNILFGMSIMRNIPSILRVGVEGQYSWTKAYSGYEDYAGVLEINGKVSMFTIEGVFEKDIAVVNNAGFFAGLKAGVVYVKHNYANSVSFKDYPGEVGKVSLSGHGDGYSFEGYLGTTRTYGKFVFSATMGYRFSKVDHMHGKIIIPYEGSYSGKVELEHDLSGVVAMARVGYRFGM